MIQTVVYVPITGQEPTIVIYRTSDNRYLDFGTRTFVASGGTKYFILPEIGDGLYGWNFDQGLYEPDTERTYKIVYENRGAYAGSAFEEVVFKWPKARFAV